MQKNCFKKKLDEARNDVQDVAHATVASELQNRKQADDDSDDFVCLVAGEANNYYEHIRIVDSGASAHMTFDHSLFLTYESQLSSGVSIVKHSRLMTVGHATMELDILVESIKRKCRLSIVLHIHELKYHLLSVPGMCEMGFNVRFEKHMAPLSKNAKVVPIGERKHDLHCLIGTTNKTIASSLALLWTLLLWHSRMAHVGCDGILQMTQNKILHGLVVDVSHKIGKCSSCVVGKATRAEIPKGGGARAKEILSLVHSDIAGPMSVPSPGGSQYFVTFIDDHSRFCFVYVLKTKGEVLQAFRKWLLLVKNQKEKIVKCMTGRGTVLQP